MPGHIAPVHRQVYQRQPHHHRMDQPAGKRKTNQHPAFDDSLDNFKTILTVPDPSNPQNGCRHPYVGPGFYRLYIMMDEGMFLFSNTKSPVWDTSKHEISSKRLTSARKNWPSTCWIPAIRSHGAAWQPTNFKVETWAPSKFVYTYRDGYIRISLLRKPKKILPEILHG